MTIALNANDGVLSHGDLEMNAARREHIAALVQDLKKIEAEIDALQAAEGESYRALSQIAKSHGDGIEIDQSEAPLRWAAISSTP